MPTFETHHHENYEGLPWWSGGKEATLQCRGPGSIPGQKTKIPHAAGQLSPCTTTHTPQREPTCCKLQSPRALEPAHHN